MSEPRQTCQICGRYVVVKPSVTGFAPAIAKAKLRKQCLDSGHVADPKYTAGFEFGSIETPGRAHLHEAGLQHRVGQDPNV